MGSINLGPNWKYAHRNTSTVPALPPVTVNRPMLGSDQPRPDWAPIVSTEKKISIVVVDHQKKSLSGTGQGVAFLSFLGYTTKS